MVTPENDVLRFQDQLFIELIQQKFGEDLPSYDLYNMLYEFYLTGARDSIEHIEKKIMKNET